MSELRGSEDISEDGSGPGDSAVDMDVVLYLVARFRVQSAFLADAGRNHSFADLNHAMIISKS
jgi:hypothetical protein